MNRRKGTVIGTSAHLLLQLVQNRLTTIIECIADNKEKRDLSQRAISVAVLVNSSDCNHWITSDIASDYIINSLDYNQRLMKLDTVFIQANCLAAQLNIVFRRIINSKLWLSSLSNIFLISANHCYKYANYYDINTNLYHFRYLNSVKSPLMWTFTVKSVFGKKNELDKCLICIKKYWIYPKTVNHCISFLIYIRNWEKFIFVKC